VQYHILSTVNVLSVFESSCFLTKKIVYLHDHTNNCIEIIIQAAKHKFKISYF